MADLRHVIRRRIPRATETSKPTYGQCTNDYNRIVERVVSEKDAKGTKEALTERLKLLKLMLEDCSTLVKKKKDITKKKRQRQRIERILPCIYVTLAIAMVVFGILASWLLVQIKPEGAVSM